MATARNNEFKLIGPPYTEYPFNFAVTLSCHLSPEISAVALEIRWFKGTDCVCLYKNRQVTKGWGYEGRVNLFTQELQRGNVSLQIRDCRWSDEGDYLCQVTNGDTTEECTVGMWSTSWLDPWREAEKEAPHVQTVYVSQRGRNWTEEERMKMRESALLIDLTEKTKQLKETKHILSERDTHLMEREKQVEEKDRLLTENTTTLQMKDKILKEKDRLLTETKHELRQTTKKLVENHRIQMKEMEKRLVEKDEEFKKVKVQLKDKDITLKEKSTIIKEHLETIDKRDSLLKETNERCESVNKQLKDKNTQLENNGKLLREKETLLENTVKEVESSKKQLETLRKVLQDKSSKLQEMMTLLEQKKTKVSEKGRQLEEKERLLSERNTQLMERDKQVEEKDRLLQERTDPDSAVPVRKRNSKELEPQYLSGGTPESAVSLRRRACLQGLPPDMCQESSSAVSPESVPVAELRLVLLGRTGCGKSAAGNTILGREERSQAGASTVRQQSESRQGEVGGRQVTVVDTPDWFCPGLSLEELRQDVGLCVRLSAPGPHAFLLVVSVKQSTGEERGMLEKVEEIFGERCWRNTMILFTVTDEFQEKNIEEFIRSGNQEFQRLVEKCGSRFHCLNIKDRGDGFQISELLEKIEKLVEGNREKFYSSEIYLETDSQIREIEERIVREREEMRERQERETREKLERCEREIKMKFKELKDKFNAQINQHDEQIVKLEGMLEEGKDEESKAELERELEKEIQRRNEVQLELERLKEETEKERREMEERHRQGMEETRETYEGEAKKEAERNLMKILLPELQQRMWELMTKKQKDFDCRMDEKEKELETLRRRLRERVREGITVAGDDHQEDTRGLFNKLTQLLFWGTLSDPVIITQSEQ